MPTSLLMFILPLFSPFLFPHPSTRVYCILTLLPLSLVPSTRVYCILTLLPLSLVPSLKS